MENKKEIYWHLPGLCSLRYLNIVWLGLMKQYPDKFREGYKIASVYGTFPGAIWNGGRSVSKCGEAGLSARGIATTNTNHVAILW